MMRKVLRSVEKDSSNTDLLARGLDIGRRTVDAILEKAVKEGYAEEINGNTSCNECPLSNICRKTSSECNGLKMYILTSKGREYIKS
ncbi:MAG: hypothetical protein ACLFUR_02980 [Candidatus Hadarchaeia archaeon]